MSGTGPPGRASWKTAVLLAFLLLLAPPAGCSRSAVRQDLPPEERVAAPEPAGPSGTGRAEAPGPGVPETPAREGPEAAAASPEPAGRASADGSAGERGKEPMPAEPEPAGAAGGEPASGDAPPAVRDAPGDEAAPDVLPETNIAAKPRTSNGKPPNARGNGAPGRRDGAIPEGGVSPPAGPGGVKAVVARLPDRETFTPEGPRWTREKEELVYRVETLGIAMGYARFSFLGKVLLDGREAYHLNVKAWTSDVLSLIYPINETIDYYLDVKTLAPIRQETTKSRDREKDDVTVYDQVRGTIVSRYRRTGEIRKKADVVPNVYDPVTVAYLFRAGDLAGLERPRNLYTGRKLWEISARTIGTEKIRTDKGEVDTVIVKPVIKRNGQVVERGDLRMWMTRDERHVPVRLYAKFKKFRTWTLVGELVPDRKGG